MNVNETEQLIDEAVNFRDAIARETKLHGGKITKRAKELTDDCARVIAKALKAGVGVKVLDAMRSRPLPADIFAGAGE